MLVPEFPGAAELRVPTRSARVVGRCGCRCPTIDLAVDVAARVAEVRGGTPVWANVLDAEGGMILVVEGGRLSCLEDRRLAPAAVPDIARDFEAWTAGTVESHLSGRFLEHRREPVRVVRRGPADDQAGSVGARLLGDDVQLRGQARQVGRQIDRSSSATARPVEPGRYGVRGVRVGRGSGAHRQPSEVDEPRAGVWQRMLPVVSVAECTIAAALSESPHRLLNSLEENPEADPPRHRVRQDRLSELVRDRQGHLRGPGLEDRRRGSLGRAPQAGTARS